MRKNIVVRKTKIGDLGFHGQLFAGDKILSFCDVRRTFVLGEVLEEVCEHISEFIEVNEKAFPADTMFFTKDRGWESLKDTLRIRAQILTERGTWETIDSVKNYRPLMPLYYCGYVIGPTRVLSVNGLMTANRYELEHRDRAGYRDSLGAFVTTTPQQDSTFVLA